MKRTVLTAVIALTALAAVAQNLSRPVSRRHVPRVAVQTAITSDTIVPAPDSVVVSGFEKPLRSTRETMFVTNNTGRPLTALTLSIEYLDMRGRQLHRAVHTVAEAIPPGETRRVSVDSFDHDGLFYYHLTGSNARSGHPTPFDVRVTVASIVCPSLKDPDKK